MPGMSAGGPPTSSSEPTISEYRRREQSITIAPLHEQLEPRGASSEGTSQELLTLNFGPHHPATHGVLRLLVTLQGEVVRDVKPIIGYVHTGIEKTAEDKSYWKVIPVIERMDYLSTTSMRSPSAEPSRRCSRWRCRRAPSTCA